MEVVGPGLIFVILMVIIVVLLILFSVLRR
jgi:hypothetical protein